MGRRHGPDDNALQHNGGREKTDKTYGTHDEIDLDRGFTTDLTDSDLSKDKGRSGRKHEVGDTYDESDEDTEDDFSSCSDGDNYKTNTKVLIDRIETKETGGRLLNVFRGGISTDFSTGP